MWQPTSTIGHLKQRAEIVQQIRQFFVARQVLEVETPCLSRATVSDLHLHSLACASRTGDTFFLQTSPEYAMKRLLAAGSGAIYQIAKAFRDDESGSRHNPEFSLLEWYRPGFNHHDLMQEVDELLQLILKTASADKISYQACFQQFCDFNPHTVNEQALLDFAKKHLAQTSKHLTLSGKDAWLDFIMSHHIEAQLGKDKPVMIYDYPASQAALAKIRQDNNIFLAERFEVYYHGMELANGFHELTDSQEQAQRFQNDLVLRQQHGLPSVPLDHNLLAALESGLAPCAGVALGIDRLIMLALGVNHINDVITFPIERA